MINHVKKEQDKLAVDNWIVFSLFKLKDKAPTYYHWYSFRMQTKKAEVVFVNYYWKKNSHHLYLREREHLNVLLIAAIF